MKIYEIPFQKKGLDHGTTTACYFASLYESSSLVLVDAAIKHGQRALVGKINMINLAPPNYIETREESINNTKKFIAAVKSRNVILSYFFIYYFFIN